MFWGIVIGIFIGACLGTITASLFVSSSIENHARVIVNQYMRSEEYMQRLYYVSQRIENEGRQKTVEEYCKMVGCDRRYRTI